MDGCGGCGWLWVIVSGFLGGYGQFFGWLWMVVGGCGKLLVVTGGCEWLRMVVGCCGWLWVVFWVVMGGFLGGCG